MGLLAGAAAALGCVTVLVVAPTGTMERATTTTHGLMSLPLSAQGAISTALGREQPGYQLRGLRGFNPAQHMQLGFSRGGATVYSGRAHLGVTLSAYGYASALRPLGTVSPRASANRVSYAHGPVKEWFSNGPLGLEQGFDVAARPSTGSGPLSFSLGLSGGLTPRLQGDSLLLEGHGVTLRYGGLVATDARGRVLRSWLALVNGAVVIRVADRGAAYPLTIDPLFQQGGKLTPKSGEEIGKAFFGSKVALSSDGSTALIAGAEDASAVGAVWVFTRSGTTWTQQGNKLTAGAEASGSPYFGDSVALSSDGNTALIGGLNDHFSDGAAWVFTRSASVWTPQGAKITPKSGEETGHGRFGDLSALSSDGNTAMIGAEDDNDSIGAAWVFTRSGSTWVQQGAKLTAKSGEEVGEGRFGSSAALSADGNTALIGGRQDHAEVGAVWAFTRSGSTWSQQGAKITPKSGKETGHGRFGESIAPPPTASRQ